jgi:hypothetical protein
MYRVPAGFVAPCLPTKAPHPPTGEAWLHEIKHDGFRVIARKVGSRVKLYSRPGKTRSIFYVFGDRACLSSPAGCSQDQDIQPGSAREGFRSTHRAPRRVEV